MVTRSIYFKMTVWYAVVLGFIIGILGLFLFNNFQHTLTKDLDKLLISKAEDFKEIVATYHEEDRVESGDTFIRVFKANGKEVAQPKDLPSAVLAATAFTVAPAKLKTAFFVTRAGFRSYILPVIEKGRLRFIIQASGTLQPITLQLSRLKTALLLYLPLSIFLVIISGLFLTKRALKPVDEMTRTIRQITSKNLRQKIDVAGANDEIFRLAETFNDMLTRVDKAFSIQRQLIQDISHELRTPLTALKGKQEVALNKQRSPEEYESVLNVNLEEINKMSQLVENLLILARMEERGMPLETQPVDLNRLITQVLHDLRAFADHKHLSLSFSTAGKAFVKADEDQLAHVFSNVIDNAIKYTGAKGKISVKVATDDGSAVVEIRDTGAGMKEEELKHIFDRFYRADKSRSSPGFGLGLSIAKSIVDAHKGRIEVESKVNQGSTFRIILPLSA
jgi:two-component system, OmpR family, sensor kinase